MAARYDTDNHRALWSLCRPSHELQCLSYYLDCCGRPRCNKFLKSMIAPAISAVVLPMVLSERVGISPVGIFVGLSGLVLVLLNRKRWGPKTPSLSRQEEIDSKVIDDLETPPHDSFGASPLCICIGFGDARTGYGAFLPDIPSPDRCGLRNSWTSRAPSLDGTPQTIFIDKLSYRVCRACVLSGFRCWICGCDRGYALFNCNPEAI